MQAEVQSDIARRTAAAALVLALVGSLALTGCDRTFKGLVPMSGKLTRDGGKWPKKGTLFFGPLKSANNRPALPATAVINDDGTFEAQCSDSKGLMPGEYGVAIRCWLESPDEHRQGKSAVADKYGSAATSGLKVTVPEGGPAVVVNWDISSK